MHLRKMSSAKCRHFCLGLNVSTWVIYMSMDDDGEDVSYGLHAPDSKHDTAQANLIPYYIQIGKAFHAFRWQYQRLFHTFSHTHTHIYILRKKVHFKGLEYIHNKEMYGSMNQPLSVFVPDLRPSAGRTSMRVVSVLVPRPASNEMDRTYGLHGKIT